MKAEVGKQYQHEYEGRLWIVTITRVYKERYSMRSDRKWDWVWDGVCSEGKCWGLVSELRKML